MKFSPRAIGLIAALVTILIWTSFIVIARASASHNLLPLDIAFLRILGAGSVLLPWAWWLMRPQRQAGENPHHDHRRLVW
jgi:drug/metabolite transporter (DMT)-like permease